MAWSNDIESEKELHLSFVLFNDGNVSLVLSPQMNYEFAQNENLTRIGTGHLQLGDEADQLVLAPGESQVFQFVCSKAPPVSVDGPLGSRILDRSEAKLALGLNEIAFAFQLESRLGRRELNLKYKCRPLIAAPVPLLEFNEQANADSTTDNQR